MSGLESSYIYIDDPPYCFPYQMHQFTFPPKGTSSLSPHACQQLLCVVFLIIAVLEGMKRLISLILNNISYSGHVSHSQWPIFNVLCCCAQSWPTLCDRTGCRLPGSSVHGILQARILEWMVISSSRGSSQHRDQTHVSCVFCIGRWILYHWAT